MPETKGENIWEEESGAWDTLGDGYDSIPRFQRTTTRRLKLLERNESEIVKKLRSEVVKREEATAEEEEAVELCDDDTRWRLSGTGARAGFTAAADAASHQTPQMHRHNPPFPYLPLRGPPTLPHA